MSKYIRIQQAILIAGAFNYSHRDTGSPKIFRFGVTTQIPFASLPIRLFEQPIKPHR